MLLVRPSVSLIIKHDWSTTRLEEPDEHMIASVRIICDRAVSHCLVRHRLCSFSQESTHYINYEQLTFIIPTWLENVMPGEYSLTNDDWVDHLLEVEKVYFYLREELGWSQKQARSILPNCFKTELVMTTNMREWKHIFSLRCSSKAHPQVREIVEMIRKLIT